MLHDVRQIDFYTDELLQSEKALLNEKNNEMNDGLVQGTSGSSMFAYCHGPHKKLEQKREVVDVRMSCAITLGLDQNCDVACCETKTRS